MSHEFAVDPPKRRDDLETWLLSRLVVVFTVVINEGSSWMQGFCDLCRSGKEVVLDLAGYASSLLGLFRFLASSRQIAGRRLSPRVVLCLREIAGSEVFGLPRGTLCRRASLS